MEIGQICGTVICDDNIMCYRIFNGYHHGNPTYHYRRIPEKEKPLMIYDHQLGKYVPRDQY